MTEQEHEALESLIGVIEKSIMTKDPSEVDLYAVFYFLKILAGRPDEINFLPMTVVPKDHTLVKLLVHQDDNPLEDVEDEVPHWTIGYCGLDHNEDPNFYVVGWNWEQDCFTTEEIEPARVIGWLPFSMKAH
ncbi:hypothetical protein EVB55_226 [Rhizobium phage RHph_Y68]|uniref:Uncharacterized protein n=1 Tax=Rhizobium phage RHph_Y68 TaxID=2509787 RepID=A0A7S5R3M1_9CAUD|nr:hypothetical protein PP934_gp226 [Rhizobium phage RHph_Y68]QIG68161.1 hypothetical protein EVB55_226 [Rhizobium phage RHph_Y68]